MATYRRYGYYGLAATGAAMAGYGAYRLGRRVYKKRKFARIRARQRRNLNKVIPHRNIENASTPFGLKVDKQEFFSAFDKLLTDEQVGSPNLNEGTGINKVRYNTANITGIKLCCQLTSTTSVPLVYHVAVVTPLRSQFKAPSADWFTKDWFITNGERNAQDFNNGAVPRWMKNCIAINRREWKVHWHSKFTVETSIKQDATTVGQGARMYDKYIPLAMRVKYEDNTWDRQLYVVRWVEPLRLTDFATGDAEVMKELLWTKLYWRDN